LLQFDDRAQAQLVASIRQVKSQLGLFIAFSRLL
jgi:hypothetical protein